MTKMNDKVIFQKGYEKGFDDCKKEIKELQEELKEYFMEDKGFINLVFKNKFGEIK